MTPRKKIVSVAYAYKAEYSDTAQYAHVAVSDGDWTPDTSGSNIYRLTGNVGIGTATPNEKLHVNNEWGNGVSIFTLGTGVVSYPTEAAIAIGTAYNNRHGLAIRTSNNAIGSTSHASLWIENRGMGGHTFYAADESGDATPFVITNDGKVGIGTTTPDEELHVQGNIKMVDGNQAAGKVLTSDASGVGTWQTGGTDIDWTFRITDTADTTLMTGGAWGIARSGNVLYGDADFTHVNLGLACTTGSSGGDATYCTIGGGEFNTAGLFFATVSGGNQNTASYPYTTIGGGTRNTASNASATVGGGSGNTAGGHSSTVGGGRENTASLDYATVGGGTYNTADYYATVGGGTYNTAGPFATVGGGRYNSASGYAATVPGGYADTAAGDLSLAAGDRVRITSDGDYTFAFGRNFTTSTPNAVIFYNSAAEIKIGIDTTSPGNIITVKRESATDPVADAWTTYSSARWKENVKSIENPLDKVLALRGVSFDWKESKKHDIGLIAEEVGEVVPEVVSYEEDGINAQALDYARLTALLVEAIKEQQERISALEKQITELKR